MVIRISIENVLRIFLSDLRILDSHFYSINFIIINMQAYLRLEEIKLTLSDDEKILSDKIQKILGVKREDIISYTIVKKSIDSRDK